MGVEGGPGLSSPTTACSDPPPLCCIMQNKAAKPNSTLCIGVRGVSMDVWSQMPISAVRFWSHILVFEIRSLPGVYHSLIWLYCLTSELPATDSLAMGITSAGYYAWLLTRDKHQTEVLVFAQKTSYWSAFLLPSLFLKYKDSGHYWDCTHCS